MGANAYTFREGYNGTLEERMAAKTLKKGPNECWIWVGSRDSTGYGLIKVKGHNRHANRVAYELKHGAMPPGKIILHVCDVPACVNPAHLKIGTHKDNMQDMLQKGRGNKVRGERHWKAKLTETIVREIRDNYTKEKKTFSELARQYRVCRTTIARIVKGKSWKSGG